MLSILLVLFTIVAFIYPVESFSTKDVAHQIEGVTHSMTFTTVMAAFTGISCANAVEILLLIIHRFRLRNGRLVRGLYFWSLLISAISLIPFALTMFLLYVAPAPPRIPLLILGPLGSATVPGHSLVIYSRLHLICTRKKILRGLLWSVIIVFSFGQVPAGTCYTIYVAANKGSKVRQSLAGALGIFERAVITSYFVVEFSLAAVYLFEVSRMLRDVQVPSMGHSSIEGTGRKENSSASLFLMKYPKRILLQLLYVNIVLLLMNVVTLTLSMTGQAATAGVLHVSLPPE